MEATFDHRWRGRALRGDAAAVDLLARGAIEPLFRFCLYRVGRSHHLCEEVVQETLVRAIRDLDRYDPDRSSGNIFPWLCGLARNEIQRVLAREKFAVGLPSLWARMDEDLRTIFARLEDEPLAEETLRREETREMVNTTMSQLPPQYREVLEAKYIRDSTVRDMAAALAITEKAVESRLSRARTAFRETFLSLVKNLNVAQASRL